MMNDYSNIDAQSEMGSMIALSVEEFAIFQNEYNIYLDVRNSEFHDVYEESFRNT